MSDYNSQHGGTQIDLYLQEGHEAKEAVDEILAGIGNYVKFTDVATTGRSGAMSPTDKGVVNKASFMLKGWKLPNPTINNLTLYTDQGIYGIYRRDPMQYPSEPCLGYLLVLVDASACHHYYIGACDPTNWQAAGKEGIYTRTRKSSTWSAWQEHGDTDEIIKLIKGTSENSSAMEYPQVYKDYQATQFADPVAEAMAHMDSIGNTTNGSQESKNVGVTVLNVNGNCWRLHTFVQSYASQVYVQKIEGALQWDGTKFVSSTDYHEYTRKRTSTGWGEWKENESASSDIVDLGEFARSAGGENKAATVEYAGNPDILMMKYTITGQGAAIIHQTVNDARSTQYLVLAGQWFTRYITFTDGTRTAIAQVTAWWRTMPTNVEYNAGTRRVRLVDYNRQHSLPENKATDGFELPLATQTTDGLMSKEDKVKLEGIDTSSSLRPLYLAAGALYNDTDTDNTQTDPYGRPVTWKAHHYYLNGLGDITEEEMADIYANARGMFANQQNINYGFTGATTARTNFKPLRRGDWCLDIRALDLFYGCSKMETVAIGNSVSSTDKSGSSCTFADLVECFLACSSLRYIYGVIQPNANCNTGYVFGGCYKLEEVRVLALTQSISFADSPLLSFDSLKFLVDNANNSGSIEVEVHPDVCDLIYGDATPEAYEKSGHDAQEWGEEILRTAEDKNINFK